MAVLASLSTTPEEPGGLVYLYCCFRGSGPQLSPSRSYCAELTGKHSWTRQVFTFFPWLQTGLSGFLPITQNAPK